jgi:hypothetical protein
MNPHAIKTCKAFFCSLWVGVCTLIGTEKSKLPYCGRGGAVKIGTKIKRAIVQWKKSF